MRFFLPSFVALATLSATTAAPAASRDPIQFAIDTCLKYVPVEVRWDSLAARISCLLKPDDLTRFYADKCPGSKIAADWKAICLSGCEGEFGTVTYTDTNVTEPLCEVPPKVLTGNAKCTVTV